MRKETMKYIVGLACLSLTCLTSCDDDKDLGGKMEEMITISSVTINPTEFESGSNTISLLRNTELNLSYDIKPEEATNKKLLWTSSDESIATVTQEGKIITKDKCGSTVITVVPEIGFGAEQATVSRIIKVIDHVIEIETIDLSIAQYQGNSIELFAGDQRQLVMTVSPADHTYSKYEWKSTDTDIVTVDDKGYVKAVGVGTAVVSVKSLDGGEAIGSFTFVIKPSIPIESLTFINTEKLQELAYGGKVDLRDFCKLEPEDATFALISWESSDTDVATIENGVLNITKKTNKGATAKLTATTISGINVSLDINVVAGYFYYSFENDILPCQLSPHKGSYTNDGTKAHILLGDQNNGSWRQDLQVVNNTMNPHLYLTPKVYKYFAYKSLRPYKEGTNQAGSGVIKFDLGAGGNNGNYQGTQNNYKIFNATTGKIDDKSIEKYGEPNIYVIDLSVDNAIKGAPIITDAAGIADMTLFAIWFPDVKNDGTTKWYDMYWMGTFKDEKQLEDFVKSNK